MKKTIYYATGNAGKYQELHDYATKYLPDLDIAQFDHEIPEMQSLNQQEIAIHKALQAYAILKKPVLVDDSGIYFDKYYHFPGTMSKFVHRGIGLEGIKKLVQPGDRATFLLTLVYYYGKDRFEIFEGRCPGVVIYETVFEAPASLPYDALFSPLDTGKSYAQLRAEGNFEHYNYRIQAFKKFIDWFGKQK